MKKISVCHGKTCGPAGAPRILETLKQTYVHLGIEVVVRDCCGKCEHHNSIQINDGIIISDLAPATLEEKFINDPDRAIAKAQQDARDAIKKLDDLLADDLV